MPEDFKYVGGMGTIRPSPLVKTMAAQKVAATSGNANAGNDVTANRATANPTSTNPNPNPDLPEGVSEADVADAIARAEQGDQSAIDWLKTLGLVAGTAAGGYVLFKALKARKTTPKSMGADNVALDAAAPNAQTAVAKKAPKKPDLYVDLERDAVKPPAGYLSPQNTAPVPANKTRGRVPAVEDLSRAIRILP